MEYTFYQSINSDDDVMQGDIIVNSSQKEGKVFGVIITADCDIAQRKSNNLYTWLEILKLDDFIKHKWADEQLRKYIEKKSQIIADEINNHIKKNFPELTISAPSLCEWLKDGNINDLLNKLEISNNALKNKVIQLNHAVTSAASPIERLFKIWEINGKSKESQIQTAYELLEASSAGFSDFFFLPSIEIAGTRSGFVVLLRSINTMNFNILLKNQVEAKIKGDGDQFFRAGRLSDGVRFAIMQKFAFLFSRIGMPSEFELITQSSIKQHLQDIAQGEQNA